MKYKYFRDKLRKLYGCHDEYDMNEQIIDDMKLVDWGEHKPVIRQGRLSFVGTGKMAHRYPITYSAFLHYVNPKDIETVATLYTSPDEFFRNLTCQDTQHRIDGTVLNKGDAFESDTRNWICIDYKGKLDRSKLCCPWWYDSSNKIYMLMLHGANSGISKLKGVMR